MHSRFIITRIEIKMEDSLEILSSIVVPCNASDGTKGMLDRDSATGHETNISDLY